MKTTNIINPKIDPIIIQIKLSSLLIIIFNSIGKWSLIIAVFALSNLNSFWKLKTFAEF